MIEPSILDKYIDESCLNMNDKSRRKTQLVISNFFERKPNLAYENLNKQDFVDMLSQSACMITSSFLAYKSTIYDFVKWMYEQGYGSEKILLDFADIQYTDIDRSPFYARYYFVDLQDLSSTLDDVFEDRGTEFDTFRAAALLIWHGIEQTEVVDILKYDLNEFERTIKNSVTGQIIPLDEKVTYFLARYRDDKTYDSRKMGGRTLSYLDGRYLLRSYKSDHFTATHLSNLQTTSIKLTADYRKQFHWKQIYLSGLYYRMHEYERLKGEITRSDFEILQQFFKVQGKLTPQRKTGLVRKLNEYQEFKSLMYS